MKSKLSLFAAIVCGIIVVAACVAQAGSTFLDLPANGYYRVGIGPVKVAFVDVHGSAVTNGTVILKRIPTDLATTNAMAFGTLTCVDTVLATAITNEVWLFQDDLLERTGTATNARVRVIITQ